MLSLNTLGVLLPAIQLAIVALNFRYNSLACLMRELHAKLDKKFLKTTQKNLVRRARHNGSEDFVVKFSVFLRACICSKFSDIVVRP